MSQKQVIRRWTVIGYERELVTNGIQQFLDAVQIIVFALTEDEAIERAKRTVKKQYYRVSQVIEELDQSQIQERIASAMEENIRGPKPPWEE